MAEKGGYDNIWRPLSTPACAESQSKVCRSPYWNCKFSYSLTDSSTIVWIRWKALPKSEWKRWQNLQTCMGEPDRRREREWGSEKKECLRTWCWEVLWSLFLSTFFFLLPAGWGCYQSCRRWGVPQAWRRPRCLRWGERCRWTRQCRAPAARPRRCGWSHGLTWCRSSGRSRCSTGTVPKARPPWSSCRWRSSPGGWCGTWGARRWYQRPCLETQNMTISLRWHNAHRCWGKSSFVWSFSKLADGKERIQPTSMNPDISKMPHKAKSHGAHLQHVYHIY